MIENYAANAKKKVDFCLWMRTDVLSYSEQKQGMVQSMSLLFLFLKKMYIYYIIIGLFGFVFFTKRNVVFFPQLWAMKAI